MYHIIFAVIAIAGAACFLFSCGGTNKKDTSKALIVSINPQKYVLKQLINNDFDIIVMLPTGANHETYEPTPQDLKKVSESDVYFSLGHLDFEKAWVDRFKSVNPHLDVVNTSENINLISGHACSHHEEAGHEHAHEGIDPHIWLSVSCIKVQAQNIYNTLITKFPENKDIYTKNLTAFNQNADILNKEIAEILNHAKTKSFIIYHPALAYFARDYGWEQISMENEGKEPSAAHLKELIYTAKTKGIKKILISKEFDTRHAETLAKEIDGELIVFDPMSENWAENLKDLAQKLAKD